MQSECDGSLEDDQQPRAGVRPATDPEIPDDLGASEPVLRCAMLPIIGHYARSADEMDELYQVAWLALLQAAPHYDHRGTRLHWVRAITRRSCVKWRRDERRSAAKAERFGESRSTNQEHAEEEPTDLAADILDTTGLTMDEVYDAAVALAPRQRTVFLMRAYGPLGTSELAERLGVTEGCIKATFFKARKAVVARLKQARILPASPPC